MISDRPKHQHEWETSSRSLSPNLQEQDQMTVTITNQSILKNDPAHPRVRAFFHIQSAVSHISKFFWWPAAPQKRDDIKNIPWSHTLLADNRQSSPVSPREADPGPDAGVTQMRTGLVKALKYNREAESSCSSCTESQATFYNACLVQHKQSGKLQRLVLC